MPITAKNITGSKYGPDKKNSLSSNYAEEFEVPAGKHARVTFAFESAWENVVNIYNSDASKELVERGWHGRSKAPWDIPVNNSPNPIKYIVTGWHKKLDPRRKEDDAGNPIRHGGYPWHQSPSRESKISTALNPRYEFEDRDAPKGDWNDAVVNVQILN